MKLLKIILIFFGIYFIRRFIQMYKVMKRIQEQHEAQGKAQASSPCQHNQKNDDIVNADFKVL